MCVDLDTNRYRHLVVSVNGEGALKRGLDSFKGVWGLI